MSAQESEPRNPFHPLLLITGLFFVVTALAYAVVPMLQEDARAGESQPSPIRDSLQHHGWKWLLVELGLLVIFGLGLMLLDRSRLRRLQKEREQVTIPPPNNPATSQTVPHEPTTANREASEGS